MEQNYPKIDTNWRGGKNSTVAGHRTGSVNGDRAVMTDEQLETLRMQIALYRIISKQLFEMHKTLITTTQFQQDHLALVTSRKTLIMSSSGPAKKPRWNPTSTDLRILESIFSKAAGLPSKQKIKEIVAELRHHGPVSETNVYNWFQNRRARSKRKLQKTITTVSPPRKGDSNSNSNSNSDREMMQVIADPDQTLRPQDRSADPTPSCRVEDYFFHSPEISAELLHFIDSRLPEVETIFSSSDGNLSNETRI